MGCDTMVALPPATRDAQTVFAKNSDRPPRECQGVVQVPRRIHRSGGVVRCQYIEIPQVAETIGFIGSQPYWLWGIEHGVNEHRVAIGNEMVFTRETLGQDGLLGMDLVRLGLERAHTAHEAIDVMTALIEAYGQGGSGQPHMEWPYSNGFLAADPSEAWVLETSGREWAARRVREVANVSNGLSLGSEWERASESATASAVRRGWWADAGARLDFAAAYADPNVPSMVACPRRERAGALLAAARGQIAVPTMRAILRDHYEQGAVHRPRPAGDPLTFSLCMHADPLDNTTASMIATLPAGADTLPTIWVSLGSPCVGAFVPLYLDGTVPPVLARGGAAPDEESPWWQMRALLSLVERDRERHGEFVRERWDAFEHDTAARVARVEEEASMLRRRGDEAAARALLTRLMDDGVAGYLASLSELRAALA
jgi:dipeptidase